MTPAINLQLLRQTDASAARILALPERIAATISTTDGHHISGGVIEITQRRDGWWGSVRHLDRPGVVASMYFADGVREVLVTLEDGRHGIARITSTSFIAGAQRVCDVIGRGILA
ncbi:MAG: hypothetical protein WD359_09395 [Dehalococcoidia bacterium]